MARKKLPTPPKAEAGNEVAINREALLKGLRLVLPGVAGSDSSESMIEGSDTFVFDGDWIRSFNNNISVSFPFRTGHQFSVRGKEFYKILSKLKGGISTFRVNENSLLLSGGKTVVEMALLADKNVRDYLEGLELEKVEWFPIPNDFMEALTLCGLSVSRSSSLLSAVGFEGPDVLSSDNFRCSWYTMKQAMPFAEPVIIPLASIRELLKRSDLKEVGLSYGWAHFRDSNGAVFSVRLYEEFPFERIREFFQDDPEAQVYKFPGGFSETVERVSILGVEKEDFDGNDFITLSFGKDRISCAGVREFGRIDEDVDVPVGSIPSDISFSISAGFLQEVLKFTDTFLSFEGIIEVRKDNFRHIISTAI